jgi:hypothetical protein
MGAGKLLGPAEFPDYPRIGFQLVVLLPHLPPPPLGDYFHRNNFISPGMASLLNLSAGEDFGYEAHILAAGDSQFSKPTPI